MLNCVIFYFEFNTFSIFLPSVFDSWCIWLLFDNSPSLNSLDSLSSDSPDALDSADPLPSLEAFSSILFDDSLMSDERPEAPGNKRI